MSQMQEYEREVELIDYIEVVLKRKWLILGFTALCGVVAGLNSLGAARQFQSEALVVVSQAITTTPSSGSADGSSTFGPEIIVPGLAAQTYEALAKGDELIAALRDTLLHSGLSPEAKESLQMLSIDDITATMLEADIVAATEKAESPLLSFRVKAGSGEISVAMANVWVRMFVQRHQGLSSNVADDYYRWVLDQYETAKSNLELVERDLRPLEASQSRLSILERDARVRSSRLGEATRRKQILELSLDEKREELAFLNRTLGQVEWQDNWIGFLDDDELGRLMTRGTGGLERSELIELRRTLDGALADSLRIGPLHDALRNQARSTGRSRVLDFERRRQPQQLRAREVQIMVALDSFRADLSRLEVEVAGLEVQSRVLTQNLAEEPPTQMVAKAIVDDELWTQVTERGRADTRLQDKLGQYRLVSESLSPTYQGLAERARAAKIAYDLTQSRIEHLRVEIPRLEQDLMQTSKSLSSIAVEEDLITHEVSSDSVELEDRLMKEALPVSERLKRARSTLALLLKGYTEGKERQLLLRQEVLKLGAQLKHEQRTVERLGSQLQSQTVEIDSLTVLRDRLANERDIFEQTFSRFSRLLEEARIAREQAAGDIQIVSDAVIARPVPRGTVKKAAIAGVVALMASTMLAFLLEYVARAREQKHESPTTA